MYKKTIFHQINISKNLFIKIKNKIQKNINVINSGKKIHHFIGAKKKTIKIIQITPTPKNSTSKVEKHFIITKKYQKQNSIIILITSKKKPKTK